MADRPAKPRGSALRLNLSNSRLSLQKLLDLLDGLPCEQIDELNVSQNDLGDQAPRTLMRLLPELRTLRLSSTGLTSDGVKAAVGALTERWSIDPVLNEASQAQLESSCASSSSSSFASVLQPSSASASANCLRRSVLGLQVLDLSACSADAAAPELGLYLANQRCTLTELDLSWNTLGPDAVHQLGWQLRQNATLRTLRLAHCHLREAAGVLLACLATAGPHLPLQRLDLSRNALPTSAFEELSGLLLSSTGRRLTDLALAGNGVLAEEAASRVLGRGFQTSRPSQVVELSSASIESPGMMAGAAAEMRLDLSGTKPFFDSAFGRWDAAPQVLTVLRYPSCRVLDACFDSCSFAEAAVPILARICLNMRKFSLCSCGGNEGVLGQSFVVHLEDLARGLGQRRRNSSSGPKSSQVDHSSLQGTRSTEAPRQLPLRLILRELRLNDASLQDGSAQLLANAMHWLRVARKDGSDLEVLELAGNHITSEGVGSLTEVMSGNGFLRRFVMSRNKLKQQGAACLSEMLSARPLQAASLELELRRCALTANGALHVWRGVLSETASVSKLDLAENAIDSDTVEAMLSLAAAGRPSPGHPGKLVLLPNPCGWSPTVKLLEQMAPWSSLHLTGASLEAQSIAQLLEGIGLANGDAKTLQGESTQEAPDAELTFSLAGSALALQHWQWSIIADALTQTLTPPMRVARSANVQRFRKTSQMPTKTAFRRLGGCGAALRVELNDCNLCHTTFKAPCTVTLPDDSSTQDAVSIARSARREVNLRARGERSSPAPSLATRARQTTKGSHGLVSQAVERPAQINRTSGTPAVFCPAPRCNGDMQGAIFRSSSAPSSASGGSLKPGPPGRPQLPACRLREEEEVSCLFERHRYFDLEIRTVLRELRQVQGLRLVQCGLTDKWLAQLGHSGSSSKWSGVRLLDLRKNSLTAACCPAVATVVGGGLQSLVLDGNHLQAEGFQVLCNAVKCAGQRCSLRSLSLADNNIGHPSGSIAADLFSCEGSHSLKEFSLALNPNISNGDVVTMLRALSRAASEACQRLQFLDLAGTGAGPQALQPLARALNQRSGLVVDLSRCKALHAGGQSGIELKEGDAWQRGLPPEICQLMRDRVVL